MLNTISVNLNTDIKTERPASLPITLMSQDKNNNKFILRFTNGGETVSLDDTYTVEVLTKFTKSGTSRLTTASVTPPPFKDNQDYATWEFDTSFITRYEEVRNYVYVRKSGNLVVSADANCFVFNVGLSEIDKDAGRVAEMYDENYQKYLDEFKENVDFEEIAQAEQARKEAETLREESYEQKVDTALVEADIVGKVDNKVTELTPRMNELTAQLAQTDERIPNIANATSTLKILNPYGNFQNIHPKVLYFADGWNGYKWWMAYTPYPFGNTRQENPVLAVSNNGLDWGVPEGLENEPLEEWSGIEGSYNSDTHLVFRDDLNRLEIWWRSAYSVTRDVNLKRRTSTDGVNWTETEIMFAGIQDIDDHLSPALIHEDGKYKMLSVNLEDRTRVLRYSESVDGKNWGERVHTEVDWEGITPWHLDFVKDNGKYKLVLQAQNDTGGNNSSSLYYMESTDLISWTTPVKILSPSALPDAFDNRGIYRSSLVIIDGIHYLFYSAISTNNERSMALSSGENIYALKGYSPNIENLSQLKLTKEGKGAILKPDENIINKLDLIQSTRTSSYGHLKLGHLFFGDGDKSTTTPDNSVLRYNALNGIHETFNGSKWTGISTKVFVRLEQEIQLVSGEFVDIPFNVIELNDGRYANGLYTPISTDRFKVSFGLNFRGVNEGDSLVVQIRGSNNVDLYLVWRGKLNPDAGIQHISAVVPFITNRAWKVSVKYTGSSSNARTTNYPHQNRMLIEGF